MALTGQLFALFSVLILPRNWLLALLSLSVFQPKCTSPSNISHIQVGTQRSAVLLVGKEIMAPMKLTSQSLISAPETLCNLPSPSLSKLLCPLPPSTPLLGGSFWWLLRTTGSCPLGEFACAGMAHYLKQHPFYSHFSIALHLEPNSRSILSMILLSHNSGHLIFPHPHPHSALMILALTELLSYSCSRNGYLILPSSW